MDSKDQILGGNPAEEEEARDLIEGIDEDGNNVLLEVVRYFFYNGEEYVVLGDAHDGCCDCGCEHCDHDEDEEEEAVNLYIMKVVESEEDGEEMESFVPIDDDDLLEKLIEVVQAVLKPMMNWTINLFIFPIPVFFPPFFPSNRLLP